MVQCHPPAVSSRTAPSPIPFAPPVTTTCFIDRAPAASSTRTPGGRWSRPDEELDVGPGRRWRGEALVDHALEGDPAADQGSDIHLPGGHQLHGDRQVLVEVMLDAADDRPLALDDRPRVDRDRDADDGEQDDGAALPGRGDGVGDRRGPPAALDGHVDPTSSGPGPNRLEPRRLPAVDRGAGAQATSEVEAPGPMAQQDHARRPSRPGDLERDQPDGPIPDDRHGVAESDAGLPHRPHGDFRGLDQRRLIVTDLVRQAHTHPRLHLHVLGEPAVAVQADRGPGDAQGILVAATVEALATEEADFGNDPVADGEPLDTRPDVHDLARELVPEGDRRLLARQRVRVVDGHDHGAVPVLLHVGPADAAPAHPEEDLAGADPGNGNVLDPDVASTVPASRAHRAGGVVGHGGSWALQTEGRDLPDVIITCEDGSPRAMSPSVRGTVDAGEEVGVIRKYDAPDVLFDLHLELGEGPSWEAAAGCLSFVDILAGRVFVANPERVVDVLEVGSHVGAALPAAGGGYLVARRDGFVRLGTDGTLAPLALPLRDHPDLRFNDGKCDPTGRAWAGTMPYQRAPGRGVLYRLVGGEATPTVTGVGLSNGLGWSPDARSMYFIDTWAARIDVFDFDAASGTLGGRRTLVDLAGAGGAPDGLCVDGEGCLWVAMWGGWEIRRYAPDGRHLGSVRLPASRPTSCCFVDDMLVITSASEGLDDGELAAQPHAGAVFALRPGVSGPGATPWDRDDGDRGATQGGADPPRGPPRPGGADAGSSSRASAT